MRDNKFESANFNNAIQNSVKQSLSINYTLIITNLFIKLLSKIVFKYKLQLHVKKLVF